MSAFDGQMLLAAPSRANSKRGPLDLDIWCVSVSLSLSHSISPSLSPSLSLSLFSSISSPSSFHSEWPNQRFSSSAASISMSSLPLVSSPPSKQPSNHTHSTALPKHGTRSVRSPSSSPPNPPRAPTLSRRPSRAPLTGSSAATAPFPASASRACGMRSSYRACPRASK